MNKKLYVDDHEENMHSLWKFGGLPKHEKKNLKNQKLFFKFSL